MMYWHGGGPHGWGYLLMAASSLLFWGLLIVAGVALFRAARRPPGGGYGPRPTPEQILADRLARGEVDEDEYRRRLDALRTARTAVGED
jgi:putative membrane protein